MGDYQNLRVQPIPGLMVAKVYARVGDFDSSNDNPEHLQYGTYPGRAEAFCDVFAHPPKVCHTLADAAIDVDAAFICDSSSPRDGSDHLMLARPFLEPGISCFVDKPFAASLADARQMIDLADRYNTALMHASLLSYSPQLRAFKERFDEIGGATLLVVKGIGHTNGAVCHGIAVAHHLFGYGADSVECMGSRPNESRHWNKTSAEYCLEHILLKYPGGRQAVIMNTGHAFYPATSEFFASVYSKGGAIHSPGAGDHEFVSAGAPIINLFKQTIDTGKPPIPYRHIMEAVAVTEAARVAQKECRGVNPEEIWD